MVIVPKVTLNADLAEGFCFGCGKNNPIGMKLKFSKEGDTVRAEYTPPREFQGWPGLLHGGILATLLDEAMSHAAYTTGSTCLTASITIRQRAPIKVETPLLISARITRHGSRLIETEGKVSLKDGTIVAESTAKQFVAQSESDKADKVKEKRGHV
jgi:acyl-coenzyme A thioesterase PaaI-like protein